MLKRKSLFSVLVLLLALSLVITMVGCSSKTEEPAKTEGAKTEEVAKVDEAKEIIKATDAYLSKGLSPTIPAEDVYNKIVKGQDPTYFILDIRKPEHYQGGHIKGAVNIPYAEMYKKENIDKIPTDKKIVVVCYTGHTASQITMLLNQLGYEAYAMKFGMSAWTNDPKAMGDIKGFEKSFEFEVDTATVEAKAENEIPKVNTGKTKANDIILAATENYLTAAKSPTIGADEVYNKVVKGKDPSYFLLSIRKTEDDAKGHVPGALTIPYGQIAKEENLKKLPTDKKIVVICYTGHTASQVTMFLNQLGYDAYAMKFGIGAWTLKPEVTVLPIKPTTPLNYEMVTGTNP